MRCKYCETEFEHGHATQKYCSLGCANKQSAITSRMKARARYLEKPNLCLNCDGIIPYEKTNDNTMYCSHSCSATATNKKRKAIKHCRHCQTILENNDRTYCSHSCKWSYEHPVMLEKIRKGEIVTGTTIKAHLFRERGHRCQICEGTEWQGKDIPLELDHINGNAGDNRGHNLRLICPNCHSQTDTFRGKNKGKGRKARGLPL